MTVIMLIQFHCSHSKFTLAKHIFKTRISCRMCVFFSSPLPLHWVKNGKKYGIQVYKRNRYSCKINILNSCGSKWRWKFPISFQLAEKVATLCAHRVFVHCCSGIVCFLFVLMNESNDILCACSISSDPSDWVCCCCYRGRRRHVKSFLLFFRSLAMVFALKTHSALSIKLHINYRPNCIFIREKQTENLPANEKRFFSFIPLCRSLVLFIWFVFCSLAPVFAPTLQFTNVQNALAMVHCGYLNMLVEVTR